MAVDESTECFGVPHTTDMLSRNAKEDAIELSARHSVLAQGGDLSLSRLVSPQTFHSVGGRPLGSRVHKARVCSLLHCMRALGVVMSLHI